MLKIRLQRRGKRNYATYRVVVADSRAPIKGRFVADLGSYNPHTDAFAVDTEVTKQWLGHGAQASSTVHNLLVDHNIISAPKVTSWRPKAKTAEETSGEEAKPEPATAEKPAKSSEKKPADEAPAS